MLQFCSLMRSIRLVALLVVALSPGAAQVGPGFGGPGVGQVTWYLYGVRFSDGGTATGWLKFDYGALTCSADVVTTPGSAFSGGHYTACSAVWGAGVSRAGFQTLPAGANLAGTPALALATSSVLADTTAGGTLSILIGSSDSFENTCTSSSGPGCSVFSAPLRTVTQGTVSTTPPAQAVPALGTIGLCLLGVALMFSHWLLQRQQSDQSSG